jgi:Tfp pilus assembly protein PilF
MGRQAKRQRIRATPADGRPRNRRNAAEPATRVRAHLAVAAILLAATFVAYLPALSAGFIWDDDDYVTNNLAIQSPTGLGPIWTKPGTTVQYYPMVFTTFWLEHRMWKLDPAGYHATNVLLHALCAFLFYLLLDQLKVPGAVLAAFAFALHPVCVESVAWITERKNVLSTLFYLSSALLFLRTYDIETGGLRLSRRWGRYVASLALFALALFSKTVASTLPVALLIVIWWRRGALSRRDFLFVSPMLAMGATLSAVTVWMEMNVVGTSQIDLGLSLPGRFVVAGRAVLFYASKILWPSELTFIYPRWTVDTHPGWQLAVPLAVLAVVVTLWALRNRIGRSPLAALLLFGVTLFPALGFIDVFPMRYSFVADHFQYLAMLGPLAMIGALVTRASYETPMKRVPLQLRYAALGAVALALAVLTYRQARIYVDAKTLWSDTLRRNPAAWLAHNNLGEILLKEGRAREARGHFEEALRLNPEFVEAMVSLGFARAQAGELDEAVLLYRRALSIHPTNALCLTNLGAALLQQGKPEDAKTAFWQALRARPERAEYHRNYAMVLARTGDLQGAVSSYEEAVDRAPRNVLFRVELARLLVRSGKVEAARIQYGVARSAAVSERDSGALLTIEREASRLGR